MAARLKVKYDNELAAQLKQDRAAGLEPCECRRDVEQSPELRRDQRHLRRLEVGERFVQRHARGRGAEHGAGDDGAEDKREASDVPCG